MSPFGALLAKFLALAIAAVGSAVIVVAVVSPRLPDPPPIVVMASAPELGWVGAPIPVTVAATSDSPLERFELWVDGALTHTIPIEEQAEFVGSTFEWTGADPGWISMRVRAYEAGGAFGESKPVDIQLVSAPGRMIDEDGTADDVADQLGVPLEVLVEHNPGLNADDLLSAGSWVFLPGEDPEPEEPGDSEGGPTFKDGVLTVGPRFDGVFLYLTQDGVSHRVPENPAKTLRVTGREGKVDLKPHLPPLDQSEVVVEVWARKQGVHLLGRLVIPAHLLWEPVTQLHAIWDFKSVGIEVPVPSIKVTTKDTVRMKWSTNFAHNGVAWFLANTEPTPQGTVKPWGVYQQGIAKGNGGEFSIDLTQNGFATSAPPSGSQSGAQIVLLDPSGTTTTTTSPPNLSQLKEIAHLLTPTAWAWVVPIDGKGHPVGPPSPPVKVTMGPPPYDPNQAPPFDVVSIDLDLPPEPNPDLKECVRILSEHPPFPIAVGFGFYINEDGTVQKKGFGAAKVTGALPYPIGPDGVAIYPFTACPGEVGNFSWGDTSCGLDPLCHISNAGKALSEAAIAFGEFLGDLVNKVSEAYNGLKKWAIEQVAAHFCPAEIEGPCKTMIQIGVDALLAMAGVPPTLPEFDDLAELAKGEIVDLALDQIGVGSACDAIAGTITQKTCGEIATQLGNMDACAFAPKGQEENCRQLVSVAAEACGHPVDPVLCKTLTTNAQGLVEAGFGEVVDRSVDAFQSQITNASLGSIGFSTEWWPWGNNPGHGCIWGPAPSYPIICPPVVTANTLFGHIPEDCWIGTFGQDQGKVVCPRPAVDIQAVPEPYGQYQPIKVTVTLRRNENLTPHDFECGPITAIVTSLNPKGLTGQPYFPASMPMPSPGSMPAGSTVTLEFTLSEPNILAGAFHEDLGGDPTLSDIPISSSHWKSLLVAGSMGGARVSGNCIPDSTAGSPGGLGIAGVVPGPRPRMTPGQPQ